MRRFFLTLLVSMTTMTVLGFVCDRDLLIARSGQAVELNDLTRAQVEQTLRHYNSIYQDFFATGGDPKLIDAFPTSKEIRHFTYRDLGYLQDSGLVLVHDLADFEVVSIVSGEAACLEATVREEWNYMYQSSADRAPISELSGMTFNATYRLEQHEEGWMITGWEPASP